MATRSETYQHSLEETNGQNERTSSQDETRNGEGHGLVDDTGFHREVVEQIVKRCFVGFREGLQR